MFVWILGVSDYVSLVEPVFFFVVSFICLFASDTLSTSVLRFLPVQNARNAGHVFEMLQRCESACLKYFFTYALTCASLP